MEIAKLFKNGRSQAVRLPQAFRFTGDSVRVRRRGRAVILEPITADPTAWFEELDSFGAGTLMPEGREQPASPVRESL